MFRIVYLFPVFFIGIWILALYLISKRGWDNLAERFRMNDVFHGTRIGIISASVNGTSYNNSLVLKYNYDGIYLKTAFIFRLFHPPIFIPWKEIKYVRDKKIFFTNMKELVIGDPFIALIGLQATVYKRLEIPITIPQQ